MKIFRFLIRTEFLYMSFWTGFFVYLWRRMLFFDGTYYWTNSTNIWGDWSLHFTYIYNFLYRTFPLRHHPMYWGEPVRYHFVADLLSALLLKAGFSIVAATILPSLICSLLLAAALYIFYKHVFRHVAVAIVAPILFLFNGGLGFLWLVYDWMIQKIQTNGSVSFDRLTQFSHHDITWINTMNGELISQRAFLLGLPITLFIIIYFWRLYTAGFTSVSPKKLFVMGVVSGFLPIIHYYSFYVVVLMAVYLTLLMRMDHKPIRVWVAYFLPLIAVSSVVYMRFIGNMTPTQHVILSLGWMAPKNLAGFCWFWINNIGVMAVLIPVSYFFLPKKIRLFGIPFIFLFILSNIFIFQRDPWDNRKFLIYWYIFSAGSVAYMLVELWKKYKNFVICLALLIYFTSVVSGFTDVISLPYSPTQTHRLFSARDLAFNQQIRDKTENESVFLTLPGFSWLGMTLGRQVVMGFEPWVQNFGYPVTQRGNDIAAVYRGQEQTPTLLRKYTISYVVFGPQERARGDLNEQFFILHYPILIQNKETTIYDVRDR